MDSSIAQDSQTIAAAVDYQTEPSKYKHWRVTYDGPVATLMMDVNEDGGLRPGYKLKLNSYDLGVDIELHDALQRIRFEHPEIRSVVIYQRQESYFLLGREHLHVGTFLACVESEFLQVHKRNPQWNRRREPAFRIEISCRIERHNRRRGVRTRSGLRRDRPC